MSSSPALEEELNRVDSTALVVTDLRELDFIDSTGLGVLVRAHRRMMDAGNRFVLIEGGGQVRRLLELTGLHQQLTVVSDPEDAYTAE